MTEQNHNTWSNIAYYTSKTLSILLFPLWMPTIAISLYAHFQPLDYPTPYYYLLIGGTALFTLLLPLLTLFVLKRQKRIPDYDISEQKDRLMPFLYILVYYACWVYDLHLMKVPTIVFAEAITCTAVICLLTIITTKWKISAHLASWGCFVGSLIAVSAAMGSMNTILICVLFVLALLLMYARIYLKAHTDTQVVAGFMLGLITTLIIGIFF